MNLSSFISENFNTKASDCIGTMSEFVSTLEDKVRELEDWVEKQSDEWKTRFRNEEVFGEFLDSLSSIKDDLEDATNNFETAWQDLRINVEDPE